MTFTTMYNLLLNMIKLMSTAKDLLKAVYLLLDIVFNNNTCLNIKHNMYITMFPAYEACQ